MPVEQKSTTEGLCADCRFAREIRSDRGTRFVQCQKSFVDPRLPKYPRLPVIQCSAYAANVCESDL
jgi:hypothetical protein